MRLPSQVSGVSEDGKIQRFRDKTLWGATRDTRVAIAKVLGVPVNSSGDLVPSTAQRQATGPNGVTTSVRAELTKAGESLKDRAGKLVLNRDSSLNTRVAEAKTFSRNVLTGKFSDPASGAAEAVKDRVQTARSDIRNGVDRVKTAVKNVGK